jgi:phosphoadenosine phosphosulfate reductase
MLLDEHDQIVLEFSGGKDSLACLYLCRPHWDKITVLWSNPGDPYPETVAQMQHIAQLVPHFLEIKGEVGAWVAESGYPVDVLPVLNTGFAHTFAGTSGVRLQSVFDCCLHNLLHPMAEAVEVLGATLVVRGQKNADALKGPLRSGRELLGVTYYYPLETWTDDDVFNYLQAEGVALPEQYARGINTSFDCVGCTGFAEHNQRRWATMRDTHPDLWPQFKVRLDTVRATLQQAMTHYA